MDKLKKRRFRCIAIMLTMMMTLFQSVSASASPTDIVTFSDSNIENAVRVELGIPGGDITQGDMAFVSNLTISSGTISSLSGLEYATKLNSFTVKNCTITTDFTTLSTLTKFTSLYLQNDSITSLNGLPASTRSVDIYDSEVTYISALSGLINMKNLTIQGNKVSDISALSSMTKLDRLSLEDNNVTDITPLAGLTTLTDLSLDKNNISDLSPLANLTNLTELQLFKNNISDITPLSNLTKLIYLNLDNDNVYSPSNKITDITPLLNALPNCSTLHLYMNKIPNYNALSNINSSATIHGTAWLTVKYVDENNVYLETPYEKNINFADTFSSISVSSGDYTADDIDGYVLADSTISQVVTFDTTDLIKTIVFHYKKGPTPVTPTTPVTTPPGVTVELSHSHNHSEEPEEIKGSYIVQYKDQDTGELLEAETKKSDLDLGSYTENSKDFKNYYLNDDKTKTITLTESNPNQTIVFNYKELGSFKIRFIDESDNSLIIPEVDKKNFPLDTYVEDALYFDGYKLDDQETKKVTLDKNHLNGVIEFKYAKVKAPVPAPEELPKTGNNSKTNATTIIILLTALSSLFFIVKKKQS